MISYYKRWLKLTRLRSVLSVHAGGAGYDAFFIGEISASEISAILNCNILGGAGREVVGSYFVKAHKYRGPYNRFFMSLVLGDGKKKASFMEVRNAVALNRAGLGVELCGVVFLRNNLFLGGVAVVYRFLSGFTCLLGFEGGRLESCCLEFST